MFTLSIGLFLLFALFLVSHRLTGHVRQYALQHGMLDQPNKRSSHKTPTPRGGGLGFSILILLSIGLLLAVFPESKNIWIGLLGGGVLIASIGWLDDRWSLSAKIRIVVHLAAAAWAVYWLGGLSQLELGFAALPLGAFGGLLAVVAVVWSTNLYNFMDGIDGIAGSQALVVGSTTAALSATLGHFDLAVASSVIVASVSGFLVWNWPPAKIFMGDCGSGLLGFLLAVLAIASEGRGSVPLLVWVMLMGLFWIDTTATLAKRAFSREAWYEAHCSHAYQKVVRAGWNHRRVTVFTVLINLLLSVLAIISVRQLSMMVPLLVASTAAILLLWIGITRLDTAE